MSTKDIINGNLAILGFDNTSAVAITTKIADAIAPIIDNTITEINNSETIIKDLLISQYGYLKSAYYTSSALAFQYGDNLVINTAVNPVTGAPYLNLIYPVIDTTKQIIKQAAFQSVAAGNSNQLFIKVATIDTITGLLIPLSTPQLNSFTAYMDNFEAPGLPLNIINQAGNILNFNAICSYYAAYNLTTIQTGILNALISFQDTFIFNGEFFTGELQTYIQQQVPGIRDIYIYNTTLDGIPFAGSINLSSGYFNYAVNILDNIAYSAVQP